MYCFIWGNNSWPLSYHNKMLWLNMIKSNKEVYKCLSCKKFCRHFVSMLLVNSVVGDNVHRKICRPFSLRKKGRYQHTRVVVSDKKYIKATIIYYLEPLIYLFLCVRLMFHVLISYYGNPVQIICIMGAKTVNS